MCGPTAFAAVSPATELRDLQSAQPDEHPQAEANLRTRQGMLRSSRVNARSGNDCRITR